MENLSAVFRTQDTFVLVKKKMKKLLRKAKTLKFYNLFTIILIIKVNGMILIIRVDHF